VRPRPDDRRCRCAEHSGHVHEALDVGSGDVAHEPAQQHQVCRYETPVGVSGPGVGLNDRKCQAQLHDAPPGDGDIRGVDLDEGSGDPGTVLWAALLERAENVVALAGAGAEHANLARPAGAGVTAHASGRGTTTATICVADKPVTRAVADDLFGAFFDREAFPGTLVTVEQRRIG